MAEEKTSGKKVPATDTTSQAKTTRTKATTSDRAAGKSAGGTSAVQNNKPAKKPTSRSARAKSMATAKPDLNAPNFPLHPDSIWPD